jgi:ribonuclease J
MLLPPREIDQWPDEKIVVISTGSRASRCPALRRWPTATTRRSSCSRATPVVFSATPIPGNERAVNETIDRLYHIGCEVVTARDAPIHASGHGYAEEVKMMINLTRPKYVMPVHGDFKRMLIHSELRGGRRPALAHLPHRERNSPGDRRPTAPVREKVTRG